MTTPNLVNNVLLGSGVTASNITFVGDPNQIGYFDATASNIGLSDGIILCTEAVTKAIGPNNDGGGNISIGLGTGIGDTDLDQVAGVTNFTEDAAILEFDIIPVGDSISFNFVFASEEYLEFVNSSANDAFGLFLSGPGIAGPYSNNAVNIAKVPGTNTNITIDNVNSNINSSYYIDNGDGSPVSPQFSNNSVVQFDGFTIKIKATLKVQCGQTYHLKIAVADVSDDVYSSAVFLEANSFSTNPAIQSNLTSADDTITCGNSTTLTASSSGGAYFYLNNGLPNALGTYSVSPPSTTTYQLIVIDSNFCNTVVTDTVEHTVYVTASGPAISSNLTLTSASIFCGDSTDLTASVVGGISFSLNNGLPNNPGTYTVKPVVTTTYEFIVYDTNSCGGQITDTATVTLTVNGPSPNLSPTLTAISDTICSGDSTQLTANHIDGTAFEFNPGLPNAPGSYWVKPTTPTTYEFVVFDTVCGLVISDTANLTIHIRDTSAVSASLSIAADTICQGDSIQLTIASDMGKVHLLNGLIINQGQKWIKPNSTTTYELIVFDTTFCGITVSDTVSLELFVKPSDSALFTANVFSGCTPLQVQFTNQSPGANGNVTWLWDFGDGNTSTGISPSHSFTSASCFDVRLETTSVNACYIPMVKANYICTNPTPIADFSSSSNVFTIFNTTGIFTNLTTRANNYEWLLDGVQLSTDTNTTYGFPAIEQSYELCLIGYNRSGCVDTTCKPIIIKSEASVFTPNAITPNHDGINDVFLPITTSIYNYELIIFNRWGNIVFETIEMKESWDGKMKNGNILQGVYAWKINYKSEIDDKKYTIFGHVEIIL